MWTSRIMMIMSLLALLLMCAGCTKSVPPVPSDLQEQIVLGENIFYSKDCGKCHQAGGYPKTDEAGPKLSSVFFTQDTMHVKYHLYHIGRTDMPVIPLTSQEISAVTQFIASLHAKAYTPMNLDKVDTRCPVCGALLEKEVAIRSSLQASQGGKFYYFECPECKDIFLQNPKSYTRSGYVRNGKY